MYDDPQVSLPSVSHPDTTTAVSTNQTGPSVPVPPPATVRGSHPSFESQQPFGPVWFMAPPSWDVLQEGDPWTASEEHKQSNVSVMRCQVPGVEIKCVVGPAQESQFFFCFQM